MSGLQRIHTVDQTVTGVKGIVYIGDKILVYRRDANTNTYPGCLDLPGGGTEPGETPFQTFAREVHEEFSVTIIGDNITFAEKRQMKKDPSKAVYFMVAKLNEHTADSIQLGGEGTEWLLLTTDEYLTRTDAWPYFQNRVNEYLETA